MNFFSDKQRIALFYTCTAQILDHQALAISNSAFQILKHFAKLEKETNKYVSLSYPGIDIYFIICMIHFVPIDFMLLNISQIWEYD